MSLFSVVDEHVGRNPIARAVAISGLKKSVRAFQLQLYFLQDGTEQAANLMAASEVLAVALNIRQAQDNPTGVPVMRGAHSAILERAKREFVWRSVDAVAIDVAIDAAREAMESATARQVQDAWLAVREQA